jgi:rubrerythrin
MSSLPREVPADFAAALARLARTDRLAVEDMKLLILLELAGEPLYARLADRVAPAEAKQLLLQNGREETAHAHRLKRAIEKKTGTPYRLPSLGENPYAEPPAFPSVNAAMLTAVQQGESGGGSDYQRYADHEPDPEIAEWLRQNGREELGHRDRVARVIEMLGRA